MPNPNVVTVGPLATADDDGISLSQAVAAAGNLTITGALASGGVATLDVPRKVLLTSGGNDTGITFTVYGTNSDGNTFNEIVTGSNGATVATTLDFKTVTRIAASGAVATTIKAGTNGVASSPWQVIDLDRNPVNINIGCAVSGTVSYSIEETFDDPNAGMNPAALPVPQPYPSIEPKSNVPPKVWTDPSIATKAADFQGTILVPYFAWRLTLLSGTGSVKAQAIQAGCANN